MPRGVGEARAGLAMTQPTKDNGSAAPPSPLEPLTIEPFIGSSQFYIGCGTLTVDPAARKYLAIHDAAEGDLHLPRGRKDWGERMEATAERETFEESGFRTRLLPSHMTTRATAPRHAGADPSHPHHAVLRAARFSAGGDLASSAAGLTEPFALVPHFQPGGTLAVVFFFLGLGDSTAARVPGAESGQMEDEEYDAVWLDYDYLPPNMREMYWPVVRQGVRLARELAERDGIEALSKAAKQHWERV